MRSFAKRIIDLKMERDLKLIIRRFPRVTNIVEKVHAAIPLGA